MDPTTQPEEKKWAPPEEVTSALERLTMVGLLLLGAWATLLWPGAGLDLLQEAVKRTKSGERRWNKKNTFDQHLRLTARSIASSWWKERDRHPEVPLVNPDGAPIDPPSTDLNPEESMIQEEGQAEAQAEAKALLQFIDELFVEDDEVQLVIMLWSEGINGTGVRNSLGICEREYNTIVRRMRNKVRRHFPEWEGR